MVEGNSDNKKSDNNFIYRLGISSGEESKNITDFDLIAEYLRKINENTKDWRDDAMHVPWFRGQPNIESPLPFVLRKERESDGDKISGHYSEFWLTTTFRNRAPMFGETPDRKDMDKWLFLMQHVDVPTRLLDWTESALAALYFAVQEKEAECQERAVWMINSKALNYHSNCNKDLTAVELKNEQAHFPNTWKDTGVGIGNIRLAFRELDKEQCRFCNDKNQGSATDYIQKLMLKVMVKDVLNVEQQRNLLLYN